MKRPFSTRMFIVLTVLISVAVIIIILRQTRRCSNTHTGFEFIPEDFNSECDTLFNDTPLEGFEMSLLHKYFEPKFEVAQQSANIHKNDSEGHSAMFREEMKILHYLAGIPTVKTICETGFNYGHSSFNYLTGSEAAIVHSFDLGEHEYSRTMAKFLNETFPGRIFVHFGNSTVTVPRFIQDNPDFRCDLILVDGGHVYDVARADIENFVTIAIPYESIIVFDDYPTDWGNKFGQAWEDVLASGNVEEIMRCTLRHRIDNLQRGLVLGRVVLKK